VAARGAATFTISQSRAFWDITLQSGLRGRGDPALTADMLPSAPELNFEL